MASIKSFHQQYLRVVIVFTTKGPTIPVSSAFQAEDDKDVLVFSFNLLMIKKRIK